MSALKHEYFTYILTNPAKTVLYNGVTNDMRSRLQQHRDEASGKRGTFVGKYNCIHLLYFETYQWIQEAIAKEKKLKAGAGQRSWN